MHASCSQSIGRPAPGQIAMAASESCSDKGNTDCTISRSNAQLRPRRSNNFDISVDKWFNRGNGMVSLVFFSKWIKDDIVISRSLYTDKSGTLCQFTMPVNAQSAGGGKGIEFNVMDRNLHAFGQVIDLQANVTWLKGHESYSNGTSVVNYNAMIYQPGFIANGMMTWHIPQIKGALRTTVNYSGKYFTSFGATPGASDGFGNFFTFNPGLWHQVCPGITLKYEVMNLANWQPRHVTGDHLQHVDEMDNYGRAVYFHVVFN